MLDGFDTEVSSPTVEAQNMARALGGLAIPPGVFKGALVQKKVRLCCFSHSLAKASRSHISPIGIPHRDRR